MARDDKALTKARELLARFPLFDGHNDLPFVIRRDEANGDVKAYGLDRVHQESDTDIPRLRDGLVAAQVFAAFVPTSVPRPARFTLEQIAIGLDIESVHADVFHPARRASDVAKAKRLGKIASVLSVESAVGLEGSLSPLRVWYAAGIRILTLCHNETLDWIDSATDAPRHDGMTRFGRAVIAECNRLGIMVDLAHASPKAQHAAIDAARAPLLWSHSNAFSLCDHPRNVTDDVLARVKGNGGMVMATFVPNFISRKSHQWVSPFQRFGKTMPGIDIDAAVTEKARAEGPWPRGSISELCDHIAYIVDRTGPDHIGIGSDFYGGPNPPDLNDTSRFPHLIAELVRRGWSDAAIGKIASGNILRVWKTVERQAKALSAAEAPGIAQVSAEILTRKRRKT
ncbi:membrane dipeptidase [Phreatobacter aquaticus]|uniref:Membrane dipeptidase n=1 Tax=Phreatobacter aquaticus TaxID=2570229 RepID=A0A4D7QSY2_9HYPH|nr:dipeptidase [Phreatobacter aquaticus]QCK87162.1 membrane dipeptidase [Phreatobacter aquaticus]